MAKKKKKKLYLEKNEPRKPFVFEASYDVVIVGAGASGLACAVSCAQKASDLGAKVPKILVLEKGKRIGTSILRSGNGRCNFSNSQLDVRRFYNSSFVKTVLRAQEEQTHESVLEWFEQLGLAWMEAPSSGGLLYPYSNKATSVLEVLRQALDFYSIDMRTVVEVESIEYASVPESSSARHAKTFLFEVSVAQADEAKQLKQVATFRAKRVVVAAGGGFNAAVLPVSKKLNKWSPVLGSLAMQFPQGVSALRLDGVRAQVKLSAPRSSFEEVGEVLFREYGISGIVAFNASRYVQPGDLILLDFMPERSLEDVQELLYWRYKKLYFRTAETFLKGIFVPELAEALLVAAKIKTSQLMDNVIIAQLGKTIKAFPLRAIGIADEKLCQVKRGGMPVSEVNPATLELKQMSGVYVLGEALDVDGPCGGYNLHWAWACGLVAGNELARVLAAPTENSALEERNNKND